MQRRAAAAADPHTHTDGANERRRVRAVATRASDREREKWMKGDTHTLELGLRVEYWVAKRERERDPYRLYSPLFVSQSVCYKV